MRLEMLGGLKFKGATFRRPKPLLLLGYLALEGPKPRRYLAELFWPEAKNPPGSLSVALTQIKKAVPGVLLVDESAVEARLDTDVAVLKAAVESRAWAEVDALYRGPFLQGLDLALGPELEEWVYTWRERIEGWVSEARLALGEAALERGDLESARRFAEAALRAGEPIEDSLGVRLLLLLTASGSPLARSLARSLGLPRSVPCRLPQPATRFIGRQSLLDSIEARLLNPATRLVSLVGMGGVGKSRSALELAHRLCQRGCFVGGVYWVDLEGVEPDALAEAILSALAGRSGLAGSAWERLAGTLADRYVLLVLDNFEPLIEAAPRLSWLLARCPGLKILVTSRERLGLKEEWVIRLGGLDTRPEKAGAFSEAEMLFLERARQLNDRFTLREWDRPVLARICELVEGLPLGLELAAGWTEHDRLEGIAAAIERGAGYASAPWKNVPERHRTLRAMLEQSMALLEPEQRRAFLKLSVFVGVFRAEAAVAVLGMSASGLGGLVQKSLLEQPAPGRYRMHSLLQGFALRKLSEYGDLAQKARDAHARYYLSWLQEKTLGKEMLREMREALANLRAAWRWAVARGWDEALAEASETLKFFFDAEGRFEEGLFWMEKALSKMSDSRARGHVQTVQGWFLARVGRLEEAREVSEAARSVLERLGDVAGVQKALNNLGLQAYRAGDYTAAARAWEAALEVARARGDRRAMGRLLHNLALAAYPLGDYERAERYFLEALARDREAGYVAGEANTLNNLGNLHRLRGGLEAARRVLETGLQLARAHDLRQIEPYLLYNLGQVALDQGDVGEARARFEAALRLVRQTGERVLEGSALLNLGAALLRLGFLEVAERHIRSGLHVVWTVQDIPEVLRGLVVFSELMLAKDRQETAARVLSVVRRHPAARAHNRERAEALWQRIRGRGHGESAPPSLEAVLTELGIIRPALGYALDPG